MSNNSQFNFKLPDINQDLNIGIIGLGYVGLPLALEISKLKNRKVIGFDKKIERIKQLNNLFDNTGTAKESEIKNFLKNSIFSSNPINLKDCNVFIVCVPTPVDQYNKPDLEPIKNATLEISKIINISNSNKKKIIIYESTFFPGVTEEICGEILKRELSCDIGELFVLGYSPERISPGIQDEKKITEITKITSGSDPDTADWIDKFYGDFIAEGTYLAKSIKVAEAAKVVENVQRDLNIALMNELSLLFSYMKIDTNDVIDAAATKWNFLAFRPGLVGGHCVGVDPYYLAYAAEKYNVHTELIKSGRRINDNMSGWIARQIVRKYISTSSIISTKNILLLGACFKENCPDIRNSKSINLGEILSQYGFNVQVSDYLAFEYGILKAGNFVITKDHNANKRFAIIICAVAHDKYKKWSIDYWESLKENKDSLLVDIKNIIPRELSPMRF